jgi:3-hydroxybutyryl-CoA dehydrogenase
MEKPQIAVIGAGLMGHGIAYLFAAGGYDVRVQDPASGALEKLPLRIGDICDLLGTDRAAAERVSTGQSIEWAAGGAGIVIEAAPEKLALKQAIFADLERLAPPGAILASNIRRFRSRASRPASRIKTACSAHISGIRRTSCRWWRSC